MMQHYDAIKAAGIDEIYCLAVNDAFTMRQWGLKLGLSEEKTDDSNPVNPGNFSKCKLLPDAMCVFTRGMGMSCTWDELGERSWRYGSVPPSIGSRALASALSLCTNAVSCIPS